MENRKLLEHLTSVMRGETNADISTRIEAAATLYWLLELEKNTCQK